MAPDLRAADPVPGGMTRGVHASPARGAARRREIMLAYAFLSPVLLFFLVFLVVPFLFAIVLSFSRWNGFDLADIRLVGVRNFVGLVSSTSDFVSPILVRTVLFAAGSVSLALVASVTVANAINRLRFQGLLRTLYFLPIATTVVAVGTVWKDMYDPSGGVINGILTGLGFKSVRFLTETDTALPAIVVAQAWASLGIAVLILTAGLKAIPEGLYEAAELDGANSWHCFWRITLPLLRPVLLFVTVTQLILGLQSFALIIVMAGDGGPAGSTTVAAFEMYRQAFKFGAWGTASAMALVLFLIILAVTLFQLWFSRNQDEETLA